jgi:hypothetical protein
MHNMIVQIDYVRKTNDFLRLPLQIETENLAIYTVYALHLSTSCTQP